MTLRPILLTTLFATLTFSACSSDEPAPTSASSATSAAAPADAEGEERVAKIPILPGYKYYVGGPVVREDKYGRIRIAGFNGEVPQPPSRGMVFGAKQEGDRMEYRVWANGIILAMHRGVMRDGLYWSEYEELYRVGKLVGRQTAANDDATERTTLTTEDMDPETGEVIRTRESSVSYIQPRIIDDEEEDLDEEAGEDEEEDTTEDAAPAAE